jgi:hypothetical protein
MSSPTFNTALAAPDLAALKKEELDGLASKLRYAIKLRETETEAPDGYYTFTAGLSTLLMGLFERHTKKLREQERSNPNGEAAPQESRNKPWMDDLLGELLAISREETTRAMGYVIWEMQDQINDCKLQTLTANDDGSVKAWDEAVAFWAGSQTRDFAYGETIKDDNLLYYLGDKRCPNFKTCAAGFTGTAKVNQEILALFNRGKELARSGGTADCDPMNDIHEQIGTMMLVPFIQGTLRYLYKTRSGTQDAKTAGELWAFATAILPFVNEVNPAAADALYKRAWLLDFSGDYVADKSLLESTYSELGAGAGKGMITCADIGDLYDDPLTLLSAGTCYSSPAASTEKQDVALAAGLGAVAFVLLVAVIAVCHMKYKTEKKYEAILLKSSPV